MNIPSTWTLVMDMAGTCLTHRIAKERTARIGKVQTSTCPSSRFLRYEIDEQESRACGMLASPIQRPLDRNTFNELVMWGQEGGAPTHRLTLDTLTTESVGKPSSKCPRIKCQWRRSGTEGILHFLSISYGECGYITYHPFGTKHRYLCCTEELADGMPQSADHDLRIHGQFVPQIIRFEKWALTVLELSRLAELAHACKMAA